MQSTIRHVGFIGLGIMGSAMAANLARAGFRMTVWNRSSAKTDALVKMGANAAASPKAVAETGPDAICICVSDTPDVEDVLFRADGLAAGAQPGCIVVDHSTIAPQAARDFSERLAERGIDLIDAPVSGGDVGARNGTLTIMAGGRAAAFKACEPIFDIIGSRALHLGPSGAGQTCKSCNQVAAAVTLLGVCESLAMARRGGLDLSQVIEVIASGAAGSWQMEKLGPAIAAGDDTPGFMVELMLKDLAIVADGARRMRLPMAATALAEGYLRAAAAAGHGTSGTQVMAKIVAGLGGFQIAESTGPETKEVV